MWTVTHPFPLIHPSLLCLNTGSGWRWGSASPGRQPLPAVGWRVREEQAAAEGMMGWWLTVLDGWFGITCPRNARLGMWPSHRGPGGGSSSGIAGTWVNLLYGRHLLISRFQASRFVGSHACHCQQINAHALLMVCAMIAQYAVHFCWEVLEGLPLLLRPLSCMPAA